MWQLVRDGFSILISAADGVQMFRGEFKLICIAAVFQEHLWPHLLLNLSSNPNEGTPSVKDTTDKEVAPGFV